MKNTSNSQRKTRVAILFGGKSAEHEVSVRSAKNVVNALDKSKFEPVLIGIDRLGNWHLDVDGTLLNGVSVEADATQDSASALALLSNQSIQKSDQPGRSIAGNIDVVFPILHGPLGEDGTMQGLLELAGLPYVGPGVLGSAVGMDKDVMKRLLRDAGITITPFVTVMAYERTQLNTDAIIQKLGLPLFVKPANMGSSVGVNRATTKEELEAAVDTALRYDRKVLIETAIVGDEIECATLGNDHPKASVVGRIVPRQGDFYSYEAKYLDENGAVLEIPAQLSPEITERAREIALKTFQVLCCEGMTRVDMFATATGQILVNEVNTIPGFTKISMYPKLWEASGISYTDLITKLLELAVERFEQRIIAA